MQNYKALELLKFNPILKEKIWGGQKLHHLFKKNGQNFSEQKLTSLGESWEVSTIPGDISIISQGAHRGKKLTEIIKQDGEQLLGLKVIKKYGKQLPLLIKYIDAADDLSIQVHPADDYAKQHHQSMGKNEMWYILAAEQDAYIINGFRENITIEQYQQALNNKTLKNLLNIQYVKEGDVFFIPAGRVHAIGRGVLLAEIQQSSDITYRIYDWDRADANGNKRVLHTEHALAVMDLKTTKNAKTIYQTTSNSYTDLVLCPHFLTRLIHFCGNFTLQQPQDSFYIYMCVKGQASFEFNQKNYPLEMGESILIPAAARNKVKLHAKQEAKLLESSIP